MFSNRRIICFSLEGAETASTAEKEKEKMPKTPPLKRRRIKVLASKTRRFLRSSKPTSSKPLTSNPSSVSPMQTNPKSNGENPESKQKKEIPEEGSSQQVDPHAIKSQRNKAFPSSLLGESSLDPCLEFAFKTLTEDILVLDKNKEI